MVTKVKKEMVDGLQAAIEAAVGEALGFDIAQYYQKSEVDDALDLKADAAATTAALAEKADAADIEAAIDALEADIPAQITAGIAPAIELQKTFVASGAITDKYFVAMRSDGKVEAVSGTETLFSVGPDNTSLTAGTSFVILDAIWHAATSKLAILYIDDAATDTLSLVLGTVSDGTISFGSPVTIDSGAGYTPGKIVMNAAGTLIFAFYKGGSGQGWTRGCTISGTTLTLGAAAVGVLGATTTPRAIFIDESLSYLVCVGSANWAVASYSSSTTAVVGGFGVQTYTLTGQTNFHSFYDTTNHRLVCAGYNSTTLYAIAFVIAAGSSTNGTETSTNNAVLLSAAMASDGKVLLLTSQSASRSQISSHVLTFSTATSTINTAVATGMTASDVAPVVGGRAQLIYNSTLNKFILLVALAPGGVSTIVGNIFISVGTISSTSCSFTAPQMIYSRGYPNRLWNAYSNTAGTEVALLINDDQDGSRHHAITAKNVSGTWLVTDDHRVKSVPPNIAGHDSSARYLQAGWGVFDLGNFSATISATAYTSTTLTAAHITLPTESTNADAWIGQAQATVADGANVNGKLKGGIATGLSGLTPGVVQYLKGDGTLTTTPNGRRAGVAISATELLMEAA